MEQRTVIKIWLKLRAVKYFLLERMERAIAFGTEPYRQETQARLRILNVVSYLIAIFTFAYIVQHLFINPAVYWPTMVINLVLFVIALTVPFMHRFHVIAGGLLIVISEYIFLFVLTAYFGRKSGVQIQYIAGAAVPFFIFGLNRMPLIVVFVVFGFVLNILAWFLFPEDAAYIPYDPEVIDPIYVTAMFTTIGLIAATVYYAYNALQNARAEIQTLLRNVLPESVVDRLKSNPKHSIADEIPDTTVLFADLVGFTPLSKKLGAPETVSLLNEIVTRLDKLMKKEGVEKIKTIGDAYMAAAGVTVWNPNHCHQLARVALEIRKIVQLTARDRGLELDVRIGMASGPVTAGIIGTQKFAYDIWGETVNLAARMESHGRAGEIVVSPDVKDRLTNQYRFESLGVRDIKGIGPLETFTLSAV